MNTLVPIENYYDVYINICLVIVVLTLLHSFILPINDKKNIAFTNAIGYTLLIFSILYIGFRPISYLFGDMGNYMISFERYSLGGDIGDVKDLGWHIFMKVLANIIPAPMFFAICAFLYVFPMYRISKYLFNKYWYYSFLIFVLSFSFWAYGVNGIRNGIATSFFLWGLSYSNKKVLMYFFFLLATVFHQTLLLPIAAFIISSYYYNPKLYLIGWVLCIPLSLAMGSVWISLFSSLGFAEERLEGYLTGELEGGTGFRWDFLMYSASAVFTGWYFIYKKHFNDKFYFILYNTYLICNGFWILVIQANYSNRFAYLSWFMIGLLIIYPFLKQQFFKNQHPVIARLIFVYFSFTYLMYYIYYSNI